MYKNITLSANERSIKKAREKAMRENTSLNKEFRKWLDGYIEGNGSEKDIEENMRDFFKRTSYVRVGRKFTRDELNER